MILIIAIKLHEFIDKKNVLNEKLTSFNNPAKKKHQQQQNQKIYLIT